MLIVEFPVIGPISGLRRENSETNHLRYNTTNSYDLRMFYVIISAHYCKNHNNFLNSEIVFQNMKSVYGAA
jgi:hypothetical protein